MLKPPTTERKNSRLFYKGEITPEEEEAMSNRMGDTYQWTVYDAIVAERCREKNLPQAE